MQLILFATLLLPGADKPDDRPPLPVVALDRKDPVSFEKDVAPILEAKCTACHSGTVHRGKFDLGSFEALMKGGKSGPAVVAGKSADSLLVKQAGRTQK